MRENKEYWDLRYLNKNTGWDIGSVSTPIKEYVDQLKNKETKILIPGAGRAHEVIYAYLQGFSNIYICDISPTAINEFKLKHPEFPISQIIMGDFFKIEQTFDLIIEQTFYCAIPPKQRSNYVLKMTSILKEEGKLIGLLFSSEFQMEGPPYGGIKSNYIKRFNEYFNIKTMEKCYNSIQSRLGNELFFIMIKK